MIRSKFRIFTIASAMLISFELLHDNILRANYVIDHFENQPIGSGVNTPVDYFSFGDQLSDRGVTNQFGATSGTQSAFYVIDFNAAGFGVGAVHQGLSLTLDSGSFVSVNLRLASGLVTGGFIGFRIQDADGTVVRTLNSDLFSATSSFTTIAQTIDTIQFVDEPGTTQGLNRGNISSIGLLFYDQGYTGITTVVFDDLVVRSVPEPSSILFVGLGLLLVGFCIGSRQNSSSQKSISDG